MPNGSVVRSAARRMAICNQKGGVGKTTSAVNLGACLAEVGRRVLLIDCDPQGSATRWLGVEAGGAGLEDVLAGRCGLREAIRETATAGLAVVPASQLLAVQARFLAAEVGGERVLAMRVGREIPPEVDYLILDCPPQLGMLSIIALAAVEEVIVPVAPDPLALAALPEFEETVRLVRERLNGALRITGILPFRVRPSTRLTREVLAELAERFPDLLYTVAIRDTVRAAAASGEKKPLIACRPLPSAAEDYRRLAAEVVAQEGRGEKTVETVETVAHVAGGGDTFQT